jgi:hypothetical protein
MSELKLVIDSPTENLGGNKCRLSTNRYANLSVVIQISDFEVDTTNADTILKGLEKFKEFQQHIVELEQALNQKPAEKKA